MDGQRSFNYIKDPSFICGFQVIENATILNPGFGCDDKPYWRLAQWGSRKSISGPGQQINNSWEWSNEFKRIAVSKNGFLELAVNAEEEYLHKYRLIDEPWVHLLIEQDLQTPIDISNAQNINVALEAEITYFKSIQEAGYDPNLHGTAFVVYFILAGEKYAEHSQDIIWIGFPIFDSRGNDIPEQYFIDYAGKLIFSLASDEVGTDNAIGLLNIDFDILPKIKEAIKHAHQEGLVISDDLQSYKLNYINIGHEVWGRDIVTAKFKNLFIGVE